MESKSDSRKNTGRKNLFEKGKSGNPGGKKPMPENHKIAFRELSELGLKCLRDILDGTDPDAKTSDRLKASEIAFDRHLGKPIQQVNTNINQIKTIDTKELSNDQKDVLAALAISNMGTIEEPEEIDEIDEIDE